MASAEPLATQIYSRKPFLDNARRLAEFDTWQELAVAEAKRLGEQVRSFYSTNDEFAMNSTIVYQENDDYVMKNDDYVMKGARPGRFGAFYPTVRVHDPAR